MMKDPMNKDAFPSELSRQRFRRYMNFCERSQALRLVCSIILPKGSLLPIDRAYRSRVL
jgi:hypothetical protein